ncbi:DUF1508 domain-containing protein [Rhizobium lusitanum]|uniref:DUF1508 domain-containing protein n=1 Tax=Rhizobium lusitanum TaxID=293958 RepID=A0A6L9UHL3_9HYPH|nr:DUF1508 domain-containing protein [Rhizobium lusitanum]NEI74859.1 DUF1508 domain-containing protein [Rhizobium lusitanum]
MYRSEICEDKGGEFRFRVSDSEAMFSSEGDKAKASTIAAIESIKKNAPGASIDDQTTATA